MKVRVVGVDSLGRRDRKEWELVAKDNHGPEIPCMAAILCALKLGRGGDMGGGARVCMGLIPLNEFEGEFVRWNITSNLSHSTS